MESVKKYQKIVSLFKLYYSLLHRKKSSHPLWFSSLVISFVCPKKSSLLSIELYFSAHQSQHNIFLHLTCVLFSLVLPFLQLTLDMYMFRQRESERVKVTCFQSTLMGFFFFYFNLFHCISHAARTHNFLLPSKEKPQVFLSLFFMHVCTKKCRDHI